MARSSWWFIVLDASLFVTSHMMTSVLHCTKPSFEHGFNGGWSAAQQSVVLTDSWSAWKIARIVSLPQSWLLQYGGTRLLSRLDEGVRSCA
ncbi:hypothetical protein SCLCIDRAFT_1215537 [Scleroderma citrinum Foug A]|uniref:Secreted protein n=1 Tax=Scleroderma citrinum Foug A TaxID=1036808 RepID=A0A0C3E1E5_9AGAM|nr:hypothetical protein SCLCIDRAFT_1215537 [Scleroderma citrinum Foug A]